MLLKLGLCIVLVALSLSFSYGFSDAKDDFVDPDELSRSAFVSEDVSSTQTDHQSADFEEESDSTSKQQAGIQLMHSLLNCKPFKRFIGVVKRMQVKLYNSWQGETSFSASELSLPASDTPMAVSETSLPASDTPMTVSETSLPVSKEGYRKFDRHWPRALLKKVKQIFRTCLPSPSSRKLLQQQLNSFNFSKPQNIRTRSKDFPVPSISYQATQSHDTNSTRKSLGAIENKYMKLRGRSKSRGKEYMQSKGGHLDSGVEKVRQNSLLMERLLLRKILEMKWTFAEMDVLNLLKIIIDLEDNSHGELDRQEGKYVKAVIKGQAGLREVPPYFLSVAVGSRIIQHGTLEKLSKSTRFLTLARGLSPAILRYGGTYANFVLYDPENHSDRNLDSGEETKTLQENSTYLNNLSLTIDQQTEKNDHKEAADTSQTDEVITSLGGIEDPYDDQKHLEPDIDSQQPNDLEQNMSSDQNKHSDKDCAFYLKNDNTNILKSPKEVTYDILSAMIAANEAKTSETTKNTNKILHDEPINLPHDLFCSDYSSHTYENFTMSDQDWAILVNMTESVGMKLLFDVNQFYRTSDQKHWNPDNARMIFQDAASRGDSVIWQLGNEANSYFHKFGVNFTGKQDAHDFHQLERELSKFFPQPEIVGPDVTRPHFPSGPAVRNEIECYESGPAFLRDFLRNLQINLTAISWHQYYVDGRTATVEDFLNPEIFDYLSWQIPQIVEIRDELAIDTPIWLTETSAAWGGGAKNLSNRYADGFLWLDKLGMAASSGVDVVARQTLFSGSYALIDDQISPNPSYWLSFVHKTLVGERVLNLTLEGSSSSTRLYAHCQKVNSFSYEPGNVVMFGMNLAEKEVLVKLQGIHSIYIIEEYLLEPEGQDLQSSTMMLNGEKLHMISDEELPRLIPSVLPYKDITIPPTTFGFWVIVNSQVAECY